jgi:hypothetical protein
MNGLKWIEWSGLEVEEGERAVERMEEIFEETEKAGNAIGERIGVVGRSPERRVVTFVSPVVGSPYGVLLAFGGVR